MTVEVRPGPVLAAALVSLCVPAAAAAAGLGRPGPFGGWNGIIIISTTILAVILGIISYLGYRRDGRRKVLLVTLAFTIFAVKGIFTIGGELMGRQVDPYFDIIENLLDFGILACLFFGMTLKD